jgi:hypothetical protein
MPVAAVQAAALDHPEFGDDALLLAVHLLRIDDVLKHRALCTARTMHAAKKECSTLRGPYGSPATPNRSHCLWGGSLTREREGPIWRIGPNGLRGEHHVGARGQEHFLRHRRLGGRRLSDRSSRSSHSSPRGRRYLLLTPVPRWRRPPSFVSAPPCCYRLLRVPWPTITFAAVPFGSRGVQWKVRNPAPIFGSIRIINHRVDSAPVARIEHAGGHTWVSPEPLPTASY